MRGVGLAAALVLMMIATSAALGINTTHYRNAAQEMFQFACK